MVFQVGEGYAAPRPSQQRLVAVVPIQVEWLGQLGLIQHDEVWPLLLDQPP